VGDGEAVMRRFAKNFLPILFGLYTGSASAAG
jgi:hypothetical protein